jgi:osmotically-inducible protein OsmY
MKNDMQIQNDVLTELDRERNVVTGTIGVEVHHGVVKLAGHVSDNAIKKNAEIAAHRVDDVTSVLMDIDVTGAGAAPPSADGIARAPRVAQPG